MQQKHNHILGINQENRTVFLILSTRGQVSIGGIFSTVKLLVTNKAALVNYVGLYGCLQTHAYMLFLDGKCFIK